MLLPSLLIDLIPIGMLPGLVDASIRLDGRIKGIFSGAVVIRVIGGLPSAFMTLDHSAEVRLPRVG
jgi:hypothetical protein